ncbi:8-amino-7-oxononanoate synthase [Robertmurraya korlensis]|uniref:8-amino-7-oxononanoate synthase n=1 Tax=Robertmurraya korlensis TaxID=519977 RepID=UPI00203D3F3C|nr:8-amino-7-oxononanoate synthase [Robertmurraya korlensis]MCM3602180.1 8-amino-7-oxononanoate synthase [Robertmurraya korlensis]
MKKLVLSFVAVLIFAISISVAPAKAAYLSEYDKYIEVTPEQARAAADLLGLKNIPLGEETAQMSFEIQEAFIAKLETILKTEIDHYYIWLTINGQPVLGIDPPIVML